METFYIVGIKRKKNEVLIESTMDYNELNFRNGETTPLEPFQMKISEGSKFFDVIGFQDPFNFAISERVYSLLIEHKITGWKAFEIAIEGLNEKYYGFQILGKCGKLEEPKKSGFYTGIKFDYSSWDRSDFFCPNSTALLFCSEKAMNVLIKNKVTNIEFNDISTFETYSVG